jgi:peptidoglycan-associated lipoprotein
MRRIAILVGAGLLLALQTACPPAYPKCNNDEGCKENNEVCVQGQCVECATDGQCKENFVCQANKCVPRPPECQPGDNKCGTGKRCEAGRCVTAECDPTKPCKPGSTCQDGRCVARPPGTCDVDAECGVNEKCEANKCTPTDTTPPGTCDWSPIRFNFNEATLTSESQQRLASLADCLKRETGKVRLEGHADERGTEEYNLLLSNRRALGVPDNRLDTVGFGENRPANPGHDEAAWGENRRVELKR